MSKKVSGLDAIKQKVRQSGASGVHAAIIDTNIIEDDRKNMNMKSDPETTEKKLEEHEDREGSTGIVDTGHSKIRRSKFEDLYGRQTIWVRKEFIELIELETEGARGEKTRIFNEALESYFRKRKRI